MIRRASSVVPALAFSALLMVAAAGFAQAHVARMHALQSRQLRISARELALGAAALNVGGSIQIGSWQVRHDLKDEQTTYSASCAEGTYTISGSAEKWLKASKR